MVKKKKKPVLVLKVKIKGEVYDRVYGIKDIHYIINLFNDINRPAMEITVEEIKELKSK